MHLTNKIQKTFKIRDSLLLDPNFDLCYGIIVKVNSIMNTPIQIHMLLAKIFYDIEINEANNSNRHLH